MNIAKILKNAPKGTKLYSPIFGEVELDEVNDTFIEVENCSFRASFYSDGRYAYNGECLLFPSKDNRDWNNFYICPFKKGDFIVREYSDYQKFIAIFSHFGGFREYSTNYLCLLRPDGSFKPRADFGIGNVQEARLATDSEKKELLNAITRNGYIWNSNTLTLEKAKFLTSGKDKFNINSLKSFDKVLARDSNSNTWVCRIYSHYRNTKNYRHACVNNSYAQCIPYNDDTKHLVGTTNDCHEYYKTWEE